jgi:hypothetical protein
LNIDFGYPLGENIIRSAEGRKYSISELGTSCAKWLVPLYSVCDGLSFPDVHVGYFIKPLERVLSFDRSSEPDRVILDREIAVVPIGSTGGGALFVVDCEHGSVLLLPPGPLHDGRYDGTRAMIKVVAESVPRFLEALLDDVRAFVKNKIAHAYISDA